MGRRLTVENPEPDGSVREAVAREDQWGWTIVRTGVVGYHPIVVGVTALTCAGMLRVLNADGWKVDEPLIVSLLAETSGTPDWDDPGGWLNAQIDGRLTPPVGRMTTRMVAALDRACQIAPGRLDTVCADVAEQVRAKDWGHPEAWTAYAKRVQSQQADGRSPAVQTPDGLVEMCALIEARDSATGDLRRTLGEIVRSVHAAALPPEDCHPEEDQQAACERENRESNRRREEHMARIRGQNQRAGT